MLVLGCAAAAGAVFFAVASDRCGDSGRDVTIGRNTRSTSTTRHDYEITPPHPVNTTQRTPTLSPRPTHLKNSYPTHLFDVLEEGEREDPSGTPPVEAQYAYPLLPLHLGAPLVGTKGGQTLVGEVLGVGQSRTRPAKNALRVFHCFRFRFRCEKRG